jgi:tRNA(His) 5'-end guanylyltransferase
MATLAFNKAFEKATRAFRQRISKCWTCTDAEAKLATAYEKAIEAGGMFDARVFNLPDEEVVNCLLWRQQDATRNAIQMLGQVHFSPAELDKKSQSDIQDMLMLQKGINFNDMPTEFKRGVCCVRRNVPIDGAAEPMANIADDAKTATVKTRYQWALDREIPIFTQNREYITRALPKRP